MTRLFGDDTFGSGTFGGLDSITTAGGITYTIEVDFTTALLGVPTAWVDITTYVRTFSTRRGRSHELGRMQAGECSLTLDNRDRRFDPTYASGPYYPNVLPMAHLRIRATTASFLTYTVFTGFVDDWGQQWSGPAPQGLGDATAEVHAVDALAVLNLIDITPYPVEVLNDAPAYYYPLDATSYAMMGNLGDQDGATVEMDTTTHAFPAAAYGLASPLLGGTSGLSAGEYSVGAVNLPGLDYDARKRFINDFTIEGWVRRATSTSAVVIFEMKAATSGRMVASGFIDPNSGLTPNAMKVRTGAVTLATTTTIPASGWHHVAIVRHRTSADFYLDGAFAETLVGVPESSDVDDNANHLTTLSLGAYAGGGLAHVAAFDHALTPDRITAHYTATLGLIAAGQTVDNALTAVLDCIGWAGSLRSVGGSGHTVSAHYADPNALTELLMLAEDTDGGTLFATGDGKLRFRSAEDTQQDTSAGSSWGDSTAELRYSGLTLRNDEQDLYTEVRANAADLPDAVASDASATVTYGVRRLSSAAGVLGDSNQLTDRATGYLGRYKAPQVRPDTMLAVDSAAQPARSDAMFGTEIGDRATVTRRPPPSGSMVLPCLVEGISHSPVDALTQIRTTFNLVPVGTTPWILADTTYGVLGSTTDLGF